MTAPKTIPSVFERLADRGVRYKIVSNGDGTWYFSVFDAPADGITGTWLEGEAYFLEILDYDKSASGDGGEGF